MCKGTACIAEKRHVIDAVVTVNVTEHQLLEIPICMLHGDTRKGAFPTNVKATVQYGENLQALSVALNTVGAVSVKRTHEILSGGFNIPIATGTISNMVKRRADAVSETVNRIKQKIIESDLGYFDETGTRVDKKLWWVHDASNSEFTYLDISPTIIVCWTARCFKQRILTFKASGFCLHNCFFQPDICHRQRLLTVIDNHDLCAVCTCSK